MQVSQSRSGFFISAFALLTLSLSACSSGSSSAPGGAANSTDTVFVLNKVEWGRLVDLIDINDVVVKRDLLIEPGLVGDATYTMSVNPLTDQPTVKILFAVGTTQFSTVLASLSDELPLLDVKGTLSPTGGPPTLPIPAVPRNVALKLSFNNPIVSSTVNSNSVVVSHGANAATTLGVRYAVDSDEPASLIVDPTISQYNANQEGLVPNSTGFPEGISQNTYNIKISLPTSGGGQFAALQDVFGNNLTATIQDPVEGTNIVRVFRSALPGGIDPEGEFLPDSIAPRLVGFQLVSVTASIVSPASSSLRRITYTFDLGGDSTLLSGGVCFFKPVVGDVFVQGDAFAVVVTANPTGGNAVNPNRQSSYTIDVLPYAGTITSGSVATTQHLYTDSLTDLDSNGTTANDYSDSKRKLCFIDYSIPPKKVDLSTVPPLVAVDPASLLTLHFSKPLDPATLLAQQNVILGIVNLDPTLAANVANSYAISAIGGLGGSNMFPMQVVPSADQKAFQIAPFRPLRNDGTCTSNVANNPYYLHLLLGAQGPKDLGGNSLASASAVPGIGGATDFQMSEIRPACGGSTATNKNAGLALRFNTNNLVEDGASNNVVLAGQYTYSDPGEVSGRPVQRFYRLADQNVLPNGDPILNLVSLPAANAVQGNSPLVPVQAPLLPLGCRLMTLYRYFDLGFTMGDAINNTTGAAGADGKVDDTSQFNLDVEGLNWSPLNGQIFADKFGLIKIDLAHSNWAPDEWIFPPGQGNNPPPLLAYPNSGLMGGSTTASFANQPFEAVQANALGQVNPTTNVYVGQYLINPLFKFQVPGGGTTLFPWPSFQTTFLWRDTRLVASSSGLGVFGGGNANGVDPDVFCNVPNAFNPAPPANTQCASTANTGQDITPNNWNNGTHLNSKILAPTSAWPPAPPASASVPSIGLPLLMDFRVYQDNTAKATNFFRALEANPGQAASIIGNTPLRPYFRILTGGGILPNGSQVPVNPDIDITTGLPLVPKGEVIPGSTNPSQLGDDVIYIGSVDFVTKTSIVYTRWFDTGVNQPIFDGIMFEPSADQTAPLGISVDIAFRAITGNLLSTVAAAGDATKLDPYGNMTGFTPSTGWVPKVTDLNALNNGLNRSFQVRITFKGNASALLAARLTSFQVAWHSN